MSGLGLLATAFGSYASTLGGLYKEQVEKEQAAQEKLEAEERQREWERQKTAEARAFAIDMLQRKFDYDVKLKSMENEWEARNADIAHQRALERIGYAHELELEEQEQLKQIERRDALARLAIGLGLGAGKGGGKGIGDMDSKEFAAIVKSLSDRVKYIGEMADNANEEEKPGWLAMYNAALQDLDYFIKNRKLPEGSSFGKGSFFVDPEVIVNSLANE